MLIFNSVPAYRQTGEQVKQFIYQELRLTQIEYPNPDNPEENVVLTDYLDQIIDRFFEGLNKGSLGLVSSLLVVWASLRLLSLIETAFNHMWHVPKGRRFVHQIINYWALLTLAPLLLGVGTLRHNEIRDAQRHRSRPPVGAGPSDFLPSVGHRPVPALSGDAERQGPGRSPPCGGPPWRRWCGVSRRGDSACTSCS